MKIDDKRVSFTAANSLPLKILKHKDLINSIYDGKIKPVHLQMIPTNKCNMTCPFCSCSDRDKELEMSLETCVDVIGEFYKNGMKSITITGGGEPLMYPHIKECVDNLHSKNVDIGLVTNGLLLGKSDGDMLNKLTWCRISSGDHRRFTEGYSRQIEKAVNYGKDVDWAFSHVVSKEPNLETICKVVDFANKHKNFTHVRLVSDLFIPESIDFEIIKDELSKQGIHEDKVIYQERKNFTKGAEKCLISLLKPVVDPEGFLYPCCGAQYAEKDPSKDMSESMRMGHYKDLSDIIENSKHFDGRKCHKCYYSEYNELLDVIAYRELTHVNFV